MEFSLSAEQRELKEAAADFARAKLNQDLAKREEAGEFPAEAWRACARFGIQGLPVPAELGGGGSDVLTTVLVMEALGYGCRDNGLIFSLNAQMWSIELPLVRFGTPAQQQAYLPGLVSGEVIVFFFLRGTVERIAEFPRRVELWKGSRPDRREAEDAVHERGGNRNRRFDLGRSPASRWQHQNYVHLSFDEFDQNQIFAIDAGQEGNDKFSRISIVDQGDLPIEEKRRANDEIDQLRPRNRIPPGGSLRHAPA